ncbi:protein kinase C and casein kinase substrate in neurons protein 1-like isoform X2 [Dendronephthya gigantea]|uniref:protein kinase C and casein kinase substrate in neurons protein 1-like isoform X2 n=1 Tax=Dendronephthya gigantea TaxID=151771 RepID=UPI00106B548D|nr:protein kinase C and casein kinase substrate in neurons protein 1-like isoform X2 [Dendronephthya gigantea]
MSMKGQNRTSSTEESYTYTNFWGIDGYKNTVKRLEDGAALCDEFTKMVHERADIEMKYTLKLRDWSKRWNEKINGRISEYGSMLEVFKATLREAEDMAEIHVERHNRLKADLCESIKQWKNQHYHKSVLKWKEVKECETGFSKIYEPWARRYNKMDKSKKNFHRAAKASEHASLVASNADKDGSMPEKVKKLQDQDAKLKLELEEARKKYERRLSEMNANNDTYAEELEAEFQKWERFEQVRLSFFKDALQRYHNVVDMSESERLTNIYKGLLLKVDGSDATKDLKWWSSQYGPGMPKKWPEFEEYDPSGTSTAKSHPTTDVAVDHDNDSVDGGAQLQRETTGASLNPFDNDDDEDFVEDENTEVEAPKVNGDILDNGIPENADDVTGVPVRAKYNYDASEDDELSFQVGDIITQLSGEDGQGWCKGRLNGVEGLFPAKWVEAV